MNETVRRMLGRLVPEQIDVRSRKRDAIDAEGIDAEGIDAEGIDARGHDARGSGCVWVVRRGRRWPEPELYASVVLPDGLTGSMEIFVTAFVHKRDARSAALGFVTSRSVGDDVGVYVDRVTLDYLEKATLTSLGVAVFDDDLTYLEPVRTIPRITALDDDLPVRRISDAMEECLSMY